MQYFVGCFECFKHGNCAVVDDDGDKSCFKRDIKEDDVVWYMPVEQSGQGISIMSVDMKLARIVNWFVKKA